MAVGQLSDGIAQLQQASPHLLPPPLITAAGTTQGGATALPTTSNVARIAASASTAGVILPAMLTWLALNGGAGSPYIVIPPPTVGVKVYPASGEGLNAAATNTAIVAASAKPATFWPVGNAVGSSTAYRWAMQKGG